MNTKIKLSAFAMLATLLFAFPNVQKMSTLTQITKPHQGVYRLSEFRYGGVDLTEKYDEMSVELKRDGEAISILSDGRGVRKELSGKYRFQEKNGEITLVFSVLGKTVEVAGKIQNGKLIFAQAHNGKTVYAELERN